jgi:hypothetical protein
MRNTKNQNFLRFSIERLGMSLLVSIAGSEGGELAGGGFCSVVVMGKE